MSFNYGSRQRPSGRHFKLFSDELPRIEFDKASLEEYHNNTSKENRRSRGRRRTFRDTNHDRFSLPSLGTPEWDKLSDIEKNRPQSYSPFNPLNPNFAKIHKKIQRRHTLRETNVSDWDGPDDNFRIHPNDSVDKQQYTSAWHEKVRKSKLERDQRKAQAGENQNGNNDERNNSTENLKIVIEKPPIPKKKSVFKELLDASAKENARMNRIKEGLKFKDDSIPRHTVTKPYRLSSVNQTKRDDVNKAITNGIEEDSVVPEVISESSENLKPGILKHGVRIRETNVLKAPSKREFPVKPHLIHQEDLPLFGQDGSKGNSISNDEVRVSVYADTPMNRMDDMLFIPLPSSKPKHKRKKVNFHEHIDIKERTAMSELIEVEENGVDTDTDSFKANDSHRDSVYAEQKRRSVQVRRRANVRHGDLAKALNKHTVTIKHRHVTATLENNYNQTFPQGKSKSEYTVPGEDKQDYIDSILLSSSTNGHVNKELRSKPTWKEAKPAVAEVLIHEPDPVDIIAIANSPVELSVPGTERLTNHFGRHESPEHSHVSNLLDNKKFSYSYSPLASPLRSPPRSPPRSPVRSPPRSPDIDMVSDFTTYFDDELNFDDLPEEIDRSMLGEDLIKAYRFWDRKRKAFPGGLRKIEAPVDRHDSTYPKQYGNVKTYKITNPRIDKQPISHTSTHNKPTQGSALVDWV